MKVFVTGGTGFVGRETIKQLLSARHEVRALVREGSESKLPDAEQVELFYGDVTDGSTLSGALADCDGVIHLVGIIREFPDRGITFKKAHVESTQNIIMACREENVTRYLHMSSNGTNEHGKTAYHRTKWEAEEHVRQSGLDWTIFRPSLIFGPGGEFVNMLAEIIKKAPVVPVLGDGQYRMQPIAVKDVATSFVKALSMPESVGETYQLGGGQSYTYDEILDLTAQALGKDKAKKIHQPLFMIKPMIKALQGFEQFPITLDQLKMLIEGNVCDPQPWAEAFNINPQTYADGIKSCYK
jgi:NADH dehydrogenase